MTSPASPAGPDTSREAQQAALDLLDAVAHGSDALDIFDRARSSTAGERIALASTWRLHAGGPKTAWFHEVSGAVRDALPPAVVEALETVRVAAIRYQQHHEQHYIEDYLTLGYFAALATLAQDKAPEASRQVLALFRRPLAPHADAQSPTATRTVEWLLDNLDDLNAERFDGEGEGEVPVLTAGQLERVRRWLRAATPDGLLLWPGAPATGFAPYPGPLPPVTARLARGVWKVSIKGVASGVGSTPAEAADAAAVELLSWAENPPEAARMTPERERLVAWARGRASESVGAWLNELVSADLDVQAAVRTP